MAGLRPGPDTDALYAELVAMHDGRAIEESVQLLARLVLLLANEVGDAARVRRLMAAALAATAG
jgi:hypothetical protein